MTYFKKGKRRVIENNLYTVSVYRVIDNVMQLASLYVEGIVIMPRHLTDIIKSVFIT